MRILTVRQPWAWAIIHGQKDVENRVRNIAGDYRGPVAIHTALDDAPEDIARAYGDDDSDYASMPKMAADYLYFLDWLKEHDREVAARAWREGWLSGLDDTPNPYQEGK